MSRQCRLRPVPWTLPFRLTGHFRQLTQPWALGADLLPRTIGIHGVRMDPSTGLAVDENAIELAGAGRVTVSDALKAKVHKTADGRVAFTGGCTHRFAAGMRLALRN